MMKKLLCAVAMTMGVIGVGGALVSQPAHALDANILTFCAAEADDPNGGGIWCILNLILTILTFGVAVAGTAGLIIAGIQYITAADNPEKMAKAKSRIINVVIGLAVYAVMWAALNWLLPGGIFHA